jgi:streptomycin 6-kinase
MSSQVAVNAHAAVATPVLTPTPSASPVVHGALVHAATLTSHVPGWLTQPYRKLTG